MKAVFWTKYKNRRRGWKKGMLGKIQIHTLAYGPGGCKEKYKYRHWRRGWGCEEKYEYRGGRRVLSCEWYRWFALAAPATTGSSSSPSLLSSSSLTSSPSSPTSWAVMKHISRDCSKILWYMSCKNMCVFVGKAFIWNGDDDDKNCNCRINDGGLEDDFHDYEWFSIWLTNKS